MSLISRLGVVLGLDAGEFNKNLGIAQQRLQGFNQSIIGSRLGVAAIVTGFAVASTSAIRFADSINDVAQASELSVQTILRLNQAVVINGGKSEAAAMMVANFSRAVYEANNQNEDMQKSFKKLGISMDDLRTKSMEELLTKGIKGFGNLKDSTDRAGVSMDIFKKVAKGIDFKGVEDAFSKNKDSFSDAQKAFESIGNALDNLQKLSDTMKTGFAIQIGGAFEYITDKVIDSYNMMAKFKKFLNEHLGAFANFVPGAIYMPNEEITKRGTNDKADQEKINRAQLQNKEAIALAKKQEEFYRKELMITEAKRQRLVEEKGLAFIGESERNLALALFDIEKKRLLLVQEKKMTIDQSKQWAQSEVNLAHFMYQNEQSQKTFEYGWKKAFATYTENATNYAKLGEQAFVSLTQNMESALDKFVQTGKLNFKELAASIIQDLIKIQLKAQAISLFQSSGIGDFFSSIFSSGGGGGGAYTHSVFSAGGNELGSGQPSMVGENGPEMFIPKSAGTIIPNHSIGSMMGSQPQVVYNGPYIQNMSAIDTQSSIQFLAKNKQAVWSANQSAQRSLPQSR